MSDGVEGMKVFVKILADDSGLNSSLDSAKTKTSGLGQMLGGAMKVGAAAIGAATTAMVAFGKSAIDTGKQFDSSMSQVAATMGTTVDKIGELRDFAQTMGATTAFTASQAADGLNILAMAGYDAEKQMETLPTVLALASAGGMDLAQSADYLTGIMAGFGVEGNQAGKVADYLAKVSASAKGDVSSFGEGLSTVAGMAKTTGQSFEDMTVALGILGNNNFWCVIPDCRFRCNIHPSACSGEHIHLLGVPPISVPLFSSCE